MASTTVTTRSVWASNLESEFDLIRSALNSYPIIAMDTEFPGTVLRPAGDEFWYKNPLSHYAVLKANVDCLHLIQVGLTLSDRNGSLPNFGTSESFIWQFNFRDFNVARDPHAPDSIQLLRSKGIDFEKNRKFGIETQHFAKLMVSSGLLYNDKLNWVTFHSAYDFGYLVKALTQHALPEDANKFLCIVRALFKNRIFDVKYVVMKYCDKLYGGLDRISRILEVNRVGEPHQAGSDSLLTLRVFEKIKCVYFDNDDDLVGRYAGELHGLELGVNPQIRLLLFSDRADRSLIGVFDFSNCNAKKSLNRNLFAL